MRAVLVYLDRRVKRIELPDNLGDTYRELIPRQFSACLIDLDPQPLSMNIRQFSRRGHMFDGRSIYCEQGLEVVETACQQLCTNRADDINHADDEAFRMARRFVHDRHRSSIDLDAWQGAWPLLPSEAEEFKAQRIAKRGARFIAVVASKPQPEAGE